VVLVVGAIVIGLVVLVVGAIVVGLVVGAIVVGMVVGAIVVGAIVVGLVVGAIVVGAIVVGAELGATAVGAQLKEAGPAGVGENSTAGFVSSCPNTDTQSNRKQTNLFMTNNQRAMLQGTQNRYMEGVPINRKKNTTRS
jgi:hypothetical protein